MCCSLLAKAIMTFPRLLKLLLMLFVSRSLSPVEHDWLKRSEPARSIRFRVPAKKKVWEKHISLMIISSTKCATLEQKTPEVFCATPFLGFMTSYCCRCCQPHDVMKSKMEVRGYVKAKMDDYQIHLFWKLECSSSFFKKEKIELRLFTTVWTEVPRSSRAHTPSTFCFGEILKTSTQQNERLERKMCSISQCDQLVFKLCCSESASAFKPVEPEIFLTCEGKRPYTDKNPLFFPSVGRVWIERGLNRVLTCSD